MWRALTVSILQPVLVNVVGGRFVGRGLFGYGGRHQCLTNEAERGVEGERDGYGPGEHVEGYETEDRSSFLPAEAPEHPTANHLYRSTDKHG